jgi:hypothetical protein
MSAVFIIRQKYSAHMLTDGALVGPDLRLTGVLAKVVPLPHLNCAVTLRASEIDMFAQLVLSGLAPDMATLRSRTQEAVSKLAKLGRGLEIYVAGLEDCFMVTDAGIVEIEAFCAAPQCDAVRKLLDGRMAEDVDPAVDGLEALKLMRTTAACAGIGGFVQLTSIYRDRIVTKVLHRWPDRVGDFAAGQKGVVGAGEELFAGMG